MGPLKKIGILDGKGNTTERAMEWRSDETYPAVCRTIISEIYPQELRDLYGSLQQLDSGLEDWFARYTGAGQSRVNRFAAFYRLLLAADPTQRASDKTPVGNSKRPSSSKVITSRTSRNGKVAPTAPAKKSSLDGSIKGEDDNDESDDIRHKAIRVASEPQVHVNIQVHLSPEMTAEQIDTIFESMARNLRTLTMSSN
jgi:hypothetical protein